MSLDWQETAGELICLRSREKHLFRVRCEKGEGCKRLRQLGRIKRGEQREQKEMRAWMGLGSTAYLEF